MATTMYEPAISTCFTVTIDGKEIGIFTGCSGLGVKLAVEATEEGGEQRYIHQLPGRMSYSNIKLTRPVDRDSGMIAAWLSSMADAPVRSTAHIAARRSDGTVVAQWNLRDVLPVSWEGPQLSAESAKACTETLELAHHGFLEP